MMTRAPGEYVVAHGINTFLIEKGSGRPLLMCHGGSPGACARVNWGANIDFLADAGFTVTALAELSPSAQIDSCLTHLQPRPIVQAHVPRSRRDIKGASSRCSGSRAACRGGRSRSAPP